MDLTLGFPDAENYKRREFKELFNKVFVRDEFLDKICEPAISFLIGEKGTGKTAYSVYLQNNVHKNNKCNIKYIRETEYQKFVAMKSEKHLDLSDYTNIWKIIIYLLLSHQIKEKESGIFSKLANFSKFKALDDAIQEYYLHAFSPEIIHALQFVQESKYAAELLSKYAKASGEEKESITFSETRFQTNLLYIQKHFESALSQLKLNQGHILFIDGVDIRPESIPFDEYLSCIKGLANAIWHVNNDFFPSIRDSKGRLKVVLLLRPDIFASIGLQNSNTKLRSNSVMLDWRVNYADYRTSNIFKVADRLLSHQQEHHLELGHAWDSYFPYNLESVLANITETTSFIGFLRYSWYRPRDIISMLEVLKEIHINDTEKTSFTISDFTSPTFKQKYSEYLMSEIRDQLSFYYTAKDYEAFLKFFEFLNGSVKFDYDEYSSAYGKLVEYIASINHNLPSFMNTANEFLQFLYELNIISYSEIVDGHEKPFIHWCFKDRSYSNLSPKVKAGVNYELFYGIGRSLNAGRKIIG